MSNKSSSAPLLQAVKAGNHKKVAELLDEYGLKVDDSWTDYDILSDAVRNGNPKIIQLLLNHGCRVNKPRANVYSPLHLAVDKNYLGIVKMLLEHGASTTVKCQGLTPLHVTIKEKSPEVVKMLLAHNANVCAKDSDGYTPIHRAFIDMKSGRILDLMLSAHEGKMTNSVASGGVSIFHIACTRNKPMIIENFLQRNIDVHACTDKDCFPWQGFNGLHLAAMHYQEDIAQVLFNHKANVNVLCAHGISALWLALKYVFTDEIADKLNESLVKNKTTNKEVGVPVKTMMGFMTKEMRKTQTIQLLIEHKSDINLINNNGRPLLFEAYCPKLMWEFSSRIPNVPVIQSICKTFFIESRKKTMKILLSYGVDLTVVDKDKNTILHHIAEDTDTVTGSVEIAEKILKKGAKPNAKNIRGETPLHVAVKNGFYDYVYLLLKYKANPNSTDKERRTPLHYAEDDYIIDLLVDNGANVHAKDKEGNTPSLNVDDDGDDDDACCIS